MSVASNARARACASAVRSPLGGGSCRATAGVHVRTSRVDADIPTSRARQRLRRWRPSRAPRARAGSYSGVGLEIFVGPDGAVKVVEAFGAPYAKRRARLTKPACASDDAIAVDGVATAFALAVVLVYLVLAVRTRVAPVTVVLSVERKVKGGKRVAKKPLERRAESIRPRTILLRVGRADRAAASSVLSSFGVRARAQTAAYGSYLYRQNESREMTRPFRRPASPAAFSVADGASPRGRRSRACSRAAPASSAAPSRALLAPQLAHGQAQGLVQRTHLALRDGTAVPAAPFPPGKLATSSYDVATNRSPTRPCSRDHARVPASHVWGDGAHAPSVPGGVHGRPPRRRTPKRSPR